ncbi:uncharacterized protein [Triticum aestivum]|uniref:uncharacterized protein n=1 Tax=Triticum aestivum TaxID=4565 RepID=UPI001D01F384|nr:uncharacterized protein LOC123142738 [Triticum aestivum]
MSPSVGIEPGEGTASSDQKLGDAGNFQNPVWLTEDQRAPESRTTARGEHEPSLRIYSVYVFLSESDVSQARPSQTATPGPAYLTRQLCWAAPSRKPRLPSVPAAGGAGRRHGATATRRAVPQLLRPGRQNLYAPDGSRVNHPVSLKLLSKAGAICMFSCKLIISRENC